MTWNEGSPPLPTREKKPAGGKRNPFLLMLYFLWVVVRSYFVFVGIVMTALVFVFALALVREHRGAKVAAAPVTDKPSVLTWNVDGVIAERSPVFFDMLLQRFLGEQTPYYLPDLRRQLQRAAHDDRVRALQVNLIQLGGTTAEFAELRADLEDFKKSGKPLHFHINDGDNRTFLLASVADRITMPPTASFMIPGPAFTLTYFGEALKKIGVSVEAVRMGRFKSAVEPFTSSAPSPEALENYTSIEKDLRDTLVSQVAAGRKKDPKTVEGWFRQSMFTADEAVKAGLIDAVAHEGETHDDLSEQVKVDEEIDFEDFADETMGVRDQPTSGSNRDGLALIEAVGEIYLTGSSDTAEEEITPDVLVKQIRWARDAEDVKAVVLRLSSPGGSALASEIIWQELVELAKDKPLVVSMGAYAASGGYYVAVAGSRLIAEPTTITGSIGVFSLLGNLSEFKDKYGISFYAVTQSARANLLNTGAKPTDEDRRLLEASIRDVYETFKQRVSEGRGMDPEKVEELAQGRVFTGTQALQAGLIDGLGGLPEALRAAKELAGLDPEATYPLLRYEEKHLSLSECLRNSRNLFRCMREGHSLALASLARSSLVRSKVFAGALASSGPAADAGKLFSHVARWAEVVQKERVLAVWPQHVGLEGRF